jgi:cytidine deaminase
MSDEGEEIPWERLTRAARRAQARAWAPYSKFHVGAAVLDEQGRVHVGCNVENASYGATICAERNAVAASVVAGGTRIVACVVVAPLAEPVTPCGLCRQVLREFAPHGAMAVRCVSATGQVRDFALHALLPEAFAAADLERPRHAVGPGEVDED